MNRNSYQLKLIKLADGAKKQIQVYDCMSALDPILVEKVRFIFNGYKNVIAGSLAFRNFFYPLIKNISVMYVTLTYIIEVKLMHFKSKN